MVVKIMSFELITIIFGFITMVFALLGVMFQLIASIDKSEERTGARIDKLETRLDNDIKALNVKIDTLLLSLFSRGFAKEENKDAA